MIPTPEFAKVFRFGAFELNTESGELRKYGVRVKLQPQPAKVLMLLLANPGEVTTRERIRSEVWGTATFVDFEHGLNTAINKIREALNDSVEQPRYLETLPKVGYRFLAEVESAYPGRAHRPGPVAVLPLPVDGCRTPPGSPRRVHLIVVAALTFVAVALVAMVLRWPFRETIGDAVRFSLTLPPELSFDDVGFSGSPVAFSPDGSEIVVVAREGKMTRLYRRALRDPAFHPVAGSERARAPVYSTDGKWLVYADSYERELKRLPVRGGVAEKLHRSLLAVFGVQQTTDGSLWFGDCGTGLVCRRNDGTTERLTKITFETNEFGAVDREHSFPEMLPGGSKLLYTAWTSYDASGLHVLDLSTKARSPVLRPGVAARYLRRTGHLVYAWQGDLYSVPFDPSISRVKDKPTKVLQGVAQETFAGAVYYAVSANGSLAYIPGRPQNAVGPRVWTDWKGVVDKGAPLPYFLNNARISPDGREICFFETAGEEGGTAIWVYDIASGVRRRVTKLQENAFWSIWTPDSKDLIINANRDRSGQYSLYRLPADGSGEPRRLTSGSYADMPGSVSPDGKWLLLTTQEKPASRFEVRLLELEKADAKPVPFAPSEHQQMHPEFSPDGRWVAMATNEFSKETNVVIRAFDNPRRMWKVSEGGAFEPIWSRDGRRLYFRDPSGSKIFSADLDLTSAAPKIGSAKLLFTGGFFPGGNMGRVWDVHPDGQRLLFATAPEREPRGRAVEIVLNWDGTLPGPR